LIRACIKFRGGLIKTVVLRNFEELFSLIKDKDVAELDARTISTRDIRQGRDRSAATF